MTGNAQDASMEKKSLTRLDIAKPITAHTRDWFYDKSISVLVDPDEGKPFSLDNALMQWKNIQDNVEIIGRIEEL